MYLQIITNLQMQTYKYIRIVFNILLQRFNLVISLILNKTLYKTPGGTYLFRSFYENDHALQGEMTVPGTGQCKNQDDTICKESMKIYTTKGDLGVLSLGMVNYVLALSQ